LKALCAFLVGSFQADEDKILGPGTTTANPHKVELLLPPTGNNVQYGKFCDELEFFTIIEDFTCVGSNSKRQQYLLGSVVGEQQFVVSGSDLVGATVTCRLG